LSLAIILNADDFGGREENTRATIDAFEHGALTSATIFPGMPATQIAIEYAKANPRFSFGVHLTFSTEEVERPLADPAQIPALLGPDGHFLPIRTMRRRALARRLPINQLAREIEAQIAFVRDHGVAVSHVDSHRHVHKVGLLQTALRRVLPRFGITRVRNVQDVYLSPPLTSATYWLGPLWRRGLTKRFATTDHFYMATVATRERPWDVPLLERMRSVVGTMEIGVHPGFEGWRAIERLSAGRIAAGAAEEGHRLISWNDIPPRPR
jgi:predicted glycoside hydrolase/deacetylase ChbG (UPF0249 family)